MSFTEKERPPFVTKGLVFQVIWSRFVWRLVVAFTFPELNGFVLSEWINPVTWILPVLATAGIIFGYWRYYKKASTPLNSNKLWGLCLEVLWL